MGRNEPSKPRRDVIGLLPAAGRASRLAPLPCSKEVYPIGFEFLEGTRRAKTACHFLLEKMRAAEITKAYIVLREGKWDIPAYFRSGALVDMRLGYLIAGPNCGPPCTLDEAYDFVRHAVVAFGFPDILFSGEDAFCRLLSKQSENNAQIVLGLFPADQPQKMDMVELSEDGHVTDLVIQPPETELRYSWDVAVWTPEFTEFMHRYLNTETSAGSEISVGHVIQAAIREGMRTEGVEVSDEPYYDIGTPEGLSRAIRRFGSYAEASR
jgi:glucose-1-phosphate thymidylyltransferase